MFREITTRFNSFYAQRNAPLQPYSGPYIEPSTDEELEGERYLDRIHDMFDKEAKEYQMPESEDTQCMEEFRAWILQVFGKAPKSVREILHSNRRSLFLFLYRKVCFDMYKIYVWCTHEKQERYFMDHPFFQVLKHDMKVPDLHLFPQACYCNVDRRYVETHEQARKALYDISWRQHDRTNFHSKLEKDIKNNN